MRPLPLVLALLSFATLSAPAGADEPKGGPPLFKNLKYRSIGPAAGGRVCRAAGVPGDPLTYYAATAASGLWKSSDGGLHWKPIMDDQPTSTLGALAIAPSDPNVIYVGSGEANIRGNVEVGNGIYKSSDGGKTWKHVWKQEGQIGTLIVHPTNSDVAYAAVLGKAFGPNPERGVYRTTDGGKTWNKVLFKNPDTGASDVCFDPANPRVLFAGLWQTRRKPWDFTSGGPGSGLYTSADGGDTWTQLVAAPEPGAADFGTEPAAGTRRCPGLPPGPWGKIGLAVAPSDPRRVYALIEADKGGLFRSDDGGKAWAHVNESRALRQRAWYFFTLTVHPTQPDVVWCPQVPLLKSIDGGKTFRRVRGPHHGDHHDLWIDPKNPRRIIDSNDGGLDISTNGGETWYAPPLPICQFYHISADNRRPYWVSGTIQDIGSAQGPSNSLTSHGIPLSAWHPVGGGEAGHTASDPADPNLVYATEYGGYLSRYDHRTRQARSIGIYPYNASGHGAEDLKYRFQWTAPVLVSRHDRAVYHAANVLFKTTNDGLKWTAISDDLTRNDKSKQKWSGGPITGDNTGVEVYGTIFAVAESPLQKGLLWAGSDDGLVHVTRSGGKPWANVTANIKGLPEWATVCCIEPSPFDAGTAYVVADAHRLDDRKPYLFKTADLGKTWKSLTAKMPADGYLNVVREDPKRKGLLYAGSEQGVLFSTDDGATWQALKLNLPAVRVTDLVVKDDDLVVGTNGRSIWVFDDLTPLRALTPELAAKDMHLLPALPAVRYRYAATLAERARAGAGANPPAGAVVHYHLKAPAKGEVKLEVLDDKGRLVNALSSTKEPAEPEDEGAYSAPEEKPPLSREPGLHRVVWDLKYKGAETIKGARVDSGNPRHGPLVNPGTYTLRLTAGGKAHTTTVRVLEGPRGDAEPPAKFAGELRDQLALALRIRDDITSLTHTVEQLRAVRKQVQARDELLVGDDKAAPLVQASKALLKKLDELEDKLHNPKAKVSYDILAQKGGAQLYSQLAWLFELIKGADGPPTEGLRTVYAEQHALLEKYEAEWQTVLKGDVGALNALARKLGLPGVIVPRRGPPAKKPGAGSAKARARGPARAGPRAVTCPCRATRTPCGETRGPWPPASCSTRRSCGPRRAPPRTGVRSSAAPAARAAPGCGAAGCRLSRRRCECASGCGPGPHFSRPAGSGARPGNDPCLRKCP
jgi:photosystem II stability/assembly factor-like uncharacterized protein